MEKHAATAKKRGKKRREKEEPVEDEEDHEARAAEVSTASVDPSASALLADARPSRQTSEKRSKRTFSENCRAHVKRILKHMSKGGFAWSLSPELKTFAEQVVANPKERTRLFYRCCHTAETWSKGPNALSVPPNLFGLRFTTLPPDPRCDEGQKRMSTCAFCTLVTNTDTRKILSLISLLYTGSRLWKTLPPPAFAPVIRPGRGVLVNIPAKCGRVAVVFSGLCYFVKYPKKAAEFVKEYRLPKEHMEHRTALHDTVPDKFLVNGVKASKRPDLLVHLLFSTAVTLTLFVPSPECSPWDPEDDNPAFSSEPGYVYNILSEHDAYTLTEISAAEGLATMIDDNEEEEENSAHRGMKRVREEEKEKEEEEEKDVEDAMVLDQNDDDDSFDPMPLGDQTASSVPLIPPLHDPFNVWNTQIHLFRGKSDLDRSGSLVAQSQSPVVNVYDSLPHFELELTSCDVGTYNVLSQFGQLAVIRVCHPKDGWRTPGLVLETTGVYFCTVHAAGDTFVLLTRKMVKPPLMDLEDSYFDNVHNAKVDEYAKANDVIHVTDEILRDLVSDA